MDLDPYALNKALLRFHDSEAERAYHRDMGERTLPWMRLAWGLVLFLNLAFAWMDPLFFGDDFGLLWMARAMVAGVAIVALGASLKGPRQLLQWNSALFITTIGTFCILQVGLSDPSAFTPYITGLFFAMAGVLATPGLGFRNSVLALVGQVVMFEVVVGLVRPVSLEIFTLYTMFLPAILLVYVYIGYTAERTSRDAWSLNQRLSDTVADVNQLSGLLPICSSCKAVRDDRGYWSQIEAYVKAHSEADFSHSICPDCATELYPEVFPAEK